MTISLVRADSELATQVRSSAMPFRHSDPRSCGRKFGRHFFNQSASRKTWLNSRRSTRDDDEKPVLEVLCSSRLSVIL